MTTPQDLADRLEKAITTASNDDYTHVGTMLRQRHVNRIGVMQEVVDFLRSAPASGEMREAVAEWRRDAYGYPRRALYIGNAYVGSILYQPPQSKHYPDQWRGWFMHDDEGDQTGWFKTADEARESVEKKLDPPRLISFARTPSGETREEAGS